MHAGVVEAIVWMNAMSEMLTDAVKAVSSLAGSGW